MEIPEEIFTSATTGNPPAVSQKLKKICNTSKFILLTKVRPRFLEDVFQLTNALENMGYPALGGSASQLEGELSFNKKSRKQVH